MSEVNKYSQLKFVAEKATPGPWWVDSHGMNMTSLPNLEVVFSHPANGAPVRNEETGNLSHWRNDWDASYIATANPKTILELIADFDAQRLRADTAEAELVSTEKEVEGLQSALGDAEQRISELLVMLRQAWVDECVSAADCRKIDAALNPNPEAESHE